MTAVEDIEVRRGRKYDQVIEGARRVFLRDGFEGASVDVIAKEAGVSKATLYAYFPDKRLLFTEICNTECRRQAETAEAEIDFSASPAEVLTFAAQRIAGFVLSDFGRDMCRLLMAESARFPELARAFYDNGPGMVHQRLMHHMKRMNDEGQLSIDDLDLAAEQFAQLSKAYIHERTMFGLTEKITQADVDRAIKGAVEMFLARYGTKG